MYLFCANFTLKTGKGLSKPTIDGLTFGCGGNYHFGFAGNG